MLLRPPSTRALVAAVATAAALVSSVLIAGPAVAAQPSPVVQGVVYDASGAPARSGEVVTLVAWPSAAVLAKLKPGDPVPTSIVGGGVTSTGGSFSLGFSSTAAAAGLADSDGNVNLSVQSSAGGVEHTFNLVRHVTGGVSALSAGAAPSASDGATTIALRPVPGSTASAPVSKSSAAATPAQPNATPPCGWLVVSTVGARWVQVGEAYTTLSTTAGFTYKSGASSSIGVGVSASGGKGTFSASGTSSVSSTVTIGMPAVSGIAGRLWKTQFVFTKYGYNCAGGPVTQYMVKATSFAGGSTYSATSGAPSATYCTTYASGSHYTKDSAAAQNFSAGAALAGDLGINLSAQTGFSTNTSLNYTFAATKQLCGTNAYPPSASRLVAK